MQWHRHAGLTYSPASWSSSEPAFPDKVLTWLLASGLMMKVSRPPFSLASALSMQWGRLRVEGVKVYSLGKMAAMVDMLRARAFLRQISIMPTKWLMRCTRWQVHHHVGVGFVGSRMPEPVRAL